MLWITLSGNTYDTIMYIYEHNESWLLECFEENKVKR